MKKTIFYLIIIIGGISILLNFIQFQVYKKKNDKYILLTDSIKSLNRKMEVFYLYHSDHEFDALRTLLKFEEKKVEVGDSIKAYVGMIGLNTHLKREYGNRLPFIVTGKNLKLEKDFKLDPPFDTIIAQDWSGQIKFKTDKVGFDSICAIYYLPRKLKDPNYHKGKYRAFPMKSIYEVIKKEKR